MARIKGLGEVPKEIAPIIKALEPVTYGGRRADQVFEDWLLALDGTLTMMPRHLQSVQTTGRPAEDTPEVAEVWARLRKLYRPEDFEHFGRAFYALLDAAYEPDGKPTFRDLLGEMYMAWGWPNAATGQFFTSGDIAAMMVDLTSNGSEAVYEHLAAAIERSPEARAALLALAAGQTQAVASAAATGAIPTPGHNAGRGHHGHNGHGHRRDFDEDLGACLVADGQAIASAAVMAGGAAGDGHGPDDQEDSATAGSVIAAAMRGVLGRDEFWEQVAPLALPWYEPVTVCDPACGSGVMLLAFAATLEPWMLAGGFVAFFATDLDPTCILMARANARLYGLDNSCISGMATLTRREMAALPAHFQAAYLEAQAARRRGDLERVRAISAELRAGTYSDVMPEALPVSDETHSAELYQRLRDLLREIGAPPGEITGAELTAEPATTLALEPAVAAARQLGEAEVARVPVAARKSKAAHAKKKAQKKTAKTPPRPRRPDASRQLPLAGA